MVNVYNDTEKLLLVMFSCKVEIDLKIYRMILFLYIFSMPKPLLFLYFKKNKHAT